MKKAILVMLLSLLVLSVFASSVIAGCGCSGCNRPVLPNLSGCVGGCLEKANDTGSYLDCLDACSAQKAK